MNIALMFPIQLGTINQLGNTHDFRENFAGNSEYIFSLALTDGLPTLNVHYKKSKGF
jgi:hypothetical protein